MSKYEKRGLRYIHVIFMDRISRRSRGEEGLQFGVLRISSLLFADDVVLLASSDCDLQHSLDRYRSRVLSGWDEDQHL